MAITPPATLARPFAESGDKANIPDTTSTAGVASLTEGFPPVTQLPLSAGGIPPRRLDFNGMFNMLSQFAFWAQSGGQFRWNSALDYASPCMVFGSDGKIYFGVAPSGPGYSGVGPKNPVTAANQGTYWVGLTGYALEPASKTKLGGIMVGDGFTITAQGVLSVDPNSFSADLITELMKQLRLPQWMTASTNFYVRPDGNDNNTGLANTAAGAWKTIQRALTYIANNYNVDTYTATINIAAGIYQEKLTLPKYSATTGFIRLIGAGKENTIVRPSTEGGATVNTSAAAGTFYMYNMGFEATYPVAGGTTSVIQVNSGAALTLANISLKGSYADNTPAGLSGSLALLRIYAGASVIVGRSGGTETDIANSYLINRPSSVTNTGGATVFLLNGGTLTFNTHTSEINQTGLAVDNTTISVENLAVATTGIASTATLAFTGNIQGKRYSASTNSIISCRRGAELFPGTVAGTTSTGAQYI